MRWESRGPGWWARTVDWLTIPTVTAGKAGSRLSGSLCFSISLVLPSGEWLTLSVTLLFFFLWSCCWFQCSEESRGLCCWPLELRALEGWHLGRMTQSCISDMSMWISCLSPKNTHLDSFMWTWIMREGSANTHVLIRQTMPSVNKQGNRKTRRKGKQEQHKVSLLPIGPIGLLQRQQSLQRQDMCPDLRKKKGTVFCMIVAEGSTPCELSQNPSTWLLFSLSYSLFLFFRVLHPEFKYIGNSNFPFWISRKWYSIWVHIFF